MKNSLNLVDFHSHILPRADHGSDSVKTSSFQLEKALLSGVRRIIATPHFYPTGHTIESFLERRNSGYRQIETLFPDIKIRLGAEVLICNGIENLPGLDKLFINGTRTLLLELPFSDFQTEYCDSVYNLTKNGAEIILAHADRYSPENIEKLIECGAKLQLNADSLSGVFKKSHLYDWMERKLVVALGSDIHGEDKRAYKNFSSVISKLPSEYIGFIMGESDRIFERAKDI